MPLQIAQQSLPRHGTTEETWMCPLSGCCAPRDDASPPHDTTISTASLLNYENYMGLRRDFDTPLFFGISSLDASSKLKCDLRHEDLVGIDTINRGTNESSRRHEYIQMGQVTSARTISDKYIRAFDFALGVRYLTCAYRGCEFPLVFQTSKEAVGHVRSVHLREKPFKCTSCDTFFSRKQDAIRHVTTMNRGKKYKCSVCCSAFLRKDYRDHHEDRCLSRD